MSDLPGCLLIVTAEVDEAVEAEWNRWYDTVHLPDALRCPGVRRGRRYVSSGAISETAGGKTEKVARRIYTTVYELDGPEATGARLQGLTGPVRGHQRRAKTVVRPLRSKVSTS